MKKYLMFAFAALAFAGCSKSSDVSDDNQAKQNEIAKIQAIYQKAFEATFGKIQEGHKWGFGPVAAKTPTRAHDANGNEFGDKYYNVPDPLTSAQINVVTEWFTNNKQPQGVAIDYDNFFAQQVSSTSYGAGMDYLTCGDNDEHIANFNKGDQGVYDKVYNGKVTSETIGQDYNDRKKAVYYEDKITHMVSTSTSRFGYHNSSDSETYYDYVIIPGERISPIVAGRYFVAFDYKQIKDDGTEIVNLDGYYNDWIISITPGWLKQADKRVIAEDLTAAEKGDFDFNDVVFDVKFGTPNIITIVAAGGTLPLYVAGREVHALFNVSTSTMVNTGSGKHIDKQPVSFEYSANLGWDANNVPVYVVKNGVEVPLEANQGYAPGKICVEPYYDWCDERQDISEKYPRFIQYVGDQNVKWY